MNRTVVAVCLAGLLGAAVAVASEPADPNAEIVIVDAWLLEPEAAGEGGWLVEVDEVLNGAVPGGVLEVTGLSPELLEWGAPSLAGPGAREAERLRLVLTPGERAGYRLLSGHVSPADDPALANPAPAPLVASPWELESAPALEPKAAPATTYEQQVVTRVNEQRWANGQLPPYKLNALLDTSSEAHSSAMAMRDFFSHCDLDTGTSASTRMRAAGYLPNAAAENIAAGQSDPAAVMTSWMNSSGHRAAILSTSYREIGVGYVLQSTDQSTVRFDLNGDCAADSFGHGPYRRYWTQNFGRRNATFPVVIEREKHSVTSRTVALYVYGSGVATQMRFSNDGATWSSWQTYNPNKTWTLSSGAGWKTVYAQIRNSGGTVFQASDRIYLDTPCSASANLNLTNQTIAGTQTFQACDTISAVQGFRVNGTGDVTFQAGQTVVLGDGFQVLSGGSFRVVLQSP